MSEKFPITVKNADELIGRDTLQPVEITTTFPGQRIQRTVRMQISLVVHQRAQGVGLFSGRTEDDFIYMGTFDRNTGEGNMQLVTEVEPGQVAIVVWAITSDNDPIGEAVIFRGQTAINVIKSPIPALFIQKQPNCIPVNYTTWNETRIGNQVTISTWRKASEIDKPRGPVN